MVIKYFIYFEDYISNFFSFIYNRILLSIRLVQYEQFPIIHGRMYIDNGGLIKIGNNVIFNNHFKSNLVGLSKRCTLFVAKDAELHIGDYSGFSGVSIYCSNSIMIGHHVNIGGNVSIWDTDFHPLDYLERRENNVENIRTEPVFIGNDVFIGANTIILKGVKIGDRSIVGAGSVVSKNIPDDEIWAGNPAKFIRKI